jgi:hypothetical protein
MSQIFVVGAERKSFDGAVLVMLDDGVLGTVYELPCETATLNVGDSNAYPVLIDDNAIDVNKVPGVRCGSFDAAGFVKNDHITASGGHDFLTQSFGPRSSGQLSPWILALVPYSGGTPIIASGLWFAKASLLGHFSQSGHSAGWQFHVSGMVADPSNFYEAGAPTIPGYAGTIGAGISTFATSSVTNGAASSPTTYDAVQSIRFDLDNQLEIIPAMKNTAQRICAGFLPGSITGSLAVTQLGGAATALPQSSGNYPLNILIPDGSGSNVLTVATSVSWDSVTQQLAARGFWKDAIVYTLFSTNSGNATGTASTPWPFVIGYS